MTYDIEAGETGETGQRENPVDPPASYCEALEKDFGRVRRDFESRVRKPLKKLKAEDPDHPIFCPVSLFGTLDFGRLEIAHTRALAWLLDPEEPHGFGDGLAKAMLAHVFDSRDIHEFRVDSAGAEPRLSTDDGEEGRADIWMRGSRGTSSSAQDGTAWLVVIEAKIDAKESPGQLARYERSIARQAPNCDTKLIFLTPEERAAISGGKCWIRLGFNGLARLLWDAGRRQPEAPGYHYLRYYLAGVLKDIMEWDIPIGVDSSIPYGVMNYLEHMGIADDIEEV